MLKRILPAWRMTHLAMLVAAAPLLPSDWFFLIKKLQKEPDVQKYPFEGETEGCLDAEDVSRNVDSAAHTMR